MAKPICVVTGATGLIGSALIPALLPDFEVHGVTRRPLGVSGVTWHAMDLSVPCDPVSLPHHADAIVYLAQSEFFREFPSHCLEVYEVNTVNLLRFLDYGRRTGVRHFVLASSGGVYGAGDLSMSEELVIPARGDLGFYLTTKLCSEILAQNFSEFFSVVVLRFFFVYGLGQRQTMLIPRLITRVRNGEQIQLQGREGLRINPTHVSDSVAAILRALDLRTSHTINVGGANVLSMREIGQEIGRALGRDPVFSVNENELPRHLTGDISKMCELLGPPSVSFADGLRSMLE
jgi:UDP-glucose 4-epimerase